MKRPIVIASLAAIAIAAPAIAKPDHAKQGGGHGQGATAAVGAGGCPPGLAKKNNGCLPPGRAKKLYNVGQRFPSSYGYAWDYEQIPHHLRREYGFDPNSRYYYGDGYVYRVDPRTMVIAQVVNALLH